MKNIKILSAALVVVMLLMTMTSCLAKGGDDAVKVNCTISVIAGDTMILDEYPYEAVGSADAAPTIFEAVAGLLFYNDIAYVEDNGKFESISDVDGNPYVDGADNYYWLPTVNGEELKSRANNVEVKEGDVIVYQYTNDID